MRGLCICCWWSDNERVVHMLLVVKEHLERWTGDNEMMRIEGSYENEPRSTFVHMLASCWPKSICQVRRKGEKEAMMGFRE